MRQKKHAFADVQTIHATEITALITTKHGIYSDVNPDHSFEAMTVK
jgi:hypothetical protein